MSEGAEYAPPDFTRLHADSTFDEFLAYARYTSEAFSVYGEASEGVPIPPTKQHFDQAAEEEWGVPAQTVIDALGTVLGLQEALGFVMSHSVIRWDAKQFIENGTWVSHVLGSPDHPVCPTPTTIAAFSRLGLSPGRSAIEKRFGSWDGYLDALGYVSPTAARGWTAEQWLNNATWLSHMLGSPEAPVQPTEGDIEYAGSLRIVPPAEVVQIRFGGVAQYRLAMGFVQPDTAQPFYQGWDRDAYLQNGRWLSHVLGSQDHPALLTDDTIRTAWEHGLCPPPGAIRQMFGSLAAYQDALGFVSQETLRRWTDTDWIENGIWLSHLLGPPKQPKTPTPRQLTEGADGGICPAPADIKHKFGGVAMYRKAIEQANQQAFADWTDRQFLQHGQVVRELLPEDSYMPTHGNYYMLSGPTSYIIARRFGSLEAFHERLGLPDYDNWDEGRLLNFGVQWAVRNQNQPPSAAVIEDMEYDRSGPAARTLRGQFGSVKTYGEAITEALPVYHSLAAQLSDPPAVGEDMVRHLLREFRRGEAYAAQQRQLTQLLRTYSTRDGINAPALLELFGESRLTLHWELADFLQFGHIAFGEANRTPAECKRKLALLHQAGLAPYPQDIADVFGSLDEFITQTLAQPAAAIQSGQP